MNSVSDGNSEGKNMKRKNKKTDDKCEKKNLVVKLRRDEVILKVLK